MEPSKGTENTENGPIADKNDPSKQAKHDATGAADIEKITDFVEEAEISPQGINDAMKIVSTQQTKSIQEKQQKEKELSKIKIKKEDVELIIREMEVSKTIAERKLREHRGNIVEALRDLTN